MSDPLALMIVPFQFIRGSNYTTLKLTGHLDRTPLDAFEKELEKFSSTPTHLVINCRDLFSLSKQWLRPLLLLEKTLAALHCKVRVVQASPQIAKFFQDQGMSDAFPIRARIDEALADFGVGKKKKGIDVDFFNPFIEAAIKTLEVQCKTRPKPGSIAASTGGELKGDISGRIEFKSDTFEGVIYVSFSANTFRTILSRMIGRDLSDAASIPEDGAAEIANIILGNAKTVLIDKGYLVNTSMPSVVKGHQVPAGSSTSKGAGITIPFSSDAGDIFIDIRKNASRATH